MLKSEASSKLLTRFLPSQSYPLDRFPPVLGRWVAALFAAIITPNVWRFTSASLPGGSELDDQSRDIFCDLIRCLRGYIQPHWERIVEAVCDKARVR